MKTNSYLIQPFISIITLFLLFFSSNTYASCSDQTTDIICPDTVALIVPDQVLESDRRFYATACISKPYSNNISIQLISDDRTEIICPQTAQLQAGYTWVNIAMTVIDDTICDGSVDLTLSAIFNSLTATAHIAVNDNDAVSDIDMEKQALSDLYHSLAGDQWKNHTGWLSEDQHACAWHGISCDNGVMPVSEIRLNDQNLTGFLPSSLGNFKDLKRLFLGRNQIKGSIPDTLNQTCLHILWVPGNQLSGSITNTFCSLLFLQELNMSDNQLEGNLPSQIGQLNRLKQLNVSQNQLSGSLPRSLDQLILLSDLDIHDNYFSGNIEILQGLCQLTKIDISSNQFTGKLSTANISSLPLLRILKLNTNEFSGEFPYQMAQNNFLLSIDVHDNSLSGNLPQWEATTTYQLNALNIRSNAVYGEIPDTIVQLTRLSPGNLDLRWNGLYTRSQSVKDFIDARHIVPEWEKTQTIAPSDITATVLSAQSIRFEWSPILFTTYTGAYEIHYGYSLNLPFNKMAETSNKSETSYTVTNLNHNTIYFFKIRTRTNAHEYNRNIVYSAFSDPIQLTTNSTITTNPGENGKIEPSGTISVAHHQSILFSIIPDYGYHVQDVLIDYKSVGPITAYTFTNVMYPKKIHAYFDNDSPVLEKIDPIKFNEDAIPDPIPLTLSDRETKVDDLIIDVQSDNIELIPENLITITGSGSPKYLHLKNAPEMSGLGTIVIQVSDPQGLTATRTFPYTVNIVNDPPIAKNLIYNAYEDTEIECQFMGLDIEQDDMYYIITAEPNHGKLTHDFESTSFLYRADPNYFGRDYIKYKAQDRSSLGPEESNEATIIMNVIPKNDPPTAHAGEDILTSEGERVILDGSKSDDVDNETIHFRWIQTAGPEVVLSSPSDISPVFIAPHARPDGRPLTLIFWLTVSDDDNKSDYDSCMITVSSKDPRRLPFAQIAYPLTKVSGMAPLQVRFDDHSIGDITGWKWFFGDGLTSTLPDPIYTYDQPGNYTIYLWVTGSGGSDMISHTNCITVLPNPDAISSSIIIEERDALVDLYNTTQGYQWTWQTNWLNVPGDEHLWYGVIVPFESHHVIGLELADNQLNGFLPNSLGQLSYLQEINMSQNAIWGALPDCITRLKALTRLNLSSNNIQNILPADLNQLSKLTHLILSHNQFYGRIPDTISQLTLLKQLYLNHNQLIGNIPADFAQMKSLLDLSVSFNQLDGPLPDFIDQMTSIQRLYFSSNQFSGPVPESLMRANGLRSIFFSKNNLSGYIPEQLNTFKELQELDFSYNQFQGTIPDTLYEIPQLMLLNLSHNQLEGPLKTRITLLNQLIQLNLSHNQFTGELPTEFTRLFRLESLNLSHNSFMGEIPASISKLYDLKILNISNNSFKGSFPDSLFSLAKLESINIAGNDFFGTFSNDIRQMTWLKDNASDFRWNRLKVANRTVERFISNKQISGESWINTQTIAPSELSSKEGESWRELIFSWEPIPYTADSGGYQIFVSQDVDGPYESRYVTHSKSDSSYTLTDLSVNTTYYCKIRTITYPHENNPNTLYSDFSDILATTVYELIQRPKTPENLSAESYYDNRIMLSWKEISSSDDLYYQVYRSKTPDGIFLRISDEHLTENTWIDWDVEAGMDYYYKVRSYVGVTPSDFYSDIIHAVPGFPSTYAISGHFTHALAAQGDTAVYSFTLTASDGFTGKINVECFWENEDPPMGIDPIFYLNGYIMSPEVKSIPLPASIQLKVNTASDYTPSDLSFQLSMTDSKTKSPRIYDMILKIIPKNSCDMIIYVDKPEYDLWSLIKASGFISAPFAKEPVTINYLEGNNVLFQETVLTESDGFFETLIPQKALLPGSYTISARWRVLDEDHISCSEITHSVAIPITQSASTSRMSIYLKENQTMPVVGTSLNLEGFIRPIVEGDSQTVTIRIYSPDGLFKDYLYDISQWNPGTIDIKNITVLSQAGLWKIKGYWSGTDVYPGCESAFVEILVETPPGRAIILGTGFPEYQHQLANTTHHVCKRIYDQLIQRGFDPVEILSMMQLPEDSPLYPPPEVNEDFDWIDQINPTTPFFINALENEFKDVLHPYLPLWIFIHGFSDSKKQIRMADSYDITTARQIDEALDRLQDITNCPVIMVLDMPYSGGFISDLSDNDRIIVTSSTNTNYYADADMDMSFSIRFFEYLSAGKNVFQSFSLAQQSWYKFTKAIALIDDNADSRSTIDDGAKALQTFMNGQTFYTDLPYISDISIDNGLQYATTLPVSVTVVAGTNAIDRIKLKVLTPEPHPLYNDISTHYDFITYDLHMTKPGQYEGFLTCLNMPGSYTLVVIAEDRNAYRSDPLSLTIVSDPETPVSYFQDISDSARHSLDAICGFFTTSDPDFHQVPTPTEKSLRGVWGLHHQHVIVVGDAGTILLFDGSDWQFMESNTQERLLDVWGTASDNIYASGENGVMRHYNGSIWEIIDTEIQNSLCGIWGTGSNNIYAVGGHGTILHYNGLKWYRQYTQWYDRLNDIWGRSASDIYAAGENGRLLHFDGSSWNVLPFCTNMPINTLIGDETYLFATRFFDPVQFDQGKGWTPTRICHYMEMNDFWQSSAGHIFTVGEKGQTSIWSSPPICGAQNSSPTISPISDRNITIKQPVPPIPFTIRDAENFPYELILFAFSSNASLVPDHKIRIEGNGANRMLEVIPTYGQMGQTYISIVVEDTCGLKQASGFLLTMSADYGQTGTSENNRFGEDGIIQMDDILELLQKLGDVDHFEK
jgi:PKD repeat protein